jgi:hypothetical protein
VWPQKRPRQHLFAGAMGCMLAGRRVPCMRTGSLPRTPTWLQTHPARSRDTGCKHTHTHTHTHAHTHTHTHASTHAHTCMRRARSGAGSSSSRRGAPAATAPTRACWRGTRTHSGTPARWRACGWARGGVRVRVRVWQIGCHGVSSSSGGGAPNVSAASSAAAHLRRCEAPRDEPMRAPRWRATPTTHMQQARTQVRSQSQQRTATHTHTHDAPWPA